MKFIAACALFFLCANAHAWRDDSIVWRWGTDFREPFINAPIAKNILSFVHSGGTDSGSDYLDVDLLFSNSTDPASATSSAGAQEMYALYRHTWNILERKDLGGGLSGLGLTSGFDWNEKRDAGYNSKKRMLVFGPTVMLDVPGFLNLSLLTLWESNNPNSSAGAFNPGYPGSRYYYRTHPMLSAAWGIPLWGFSFEGYADFIAAKGKDETGHDTAPETNIDMQLMYDLCGSLGCAKNAWRLGLEYQYWHNKFGNASATVGAPGGNTARTPMIRAEYHF